jgi:hypothetical protein
MQKKDLSNPVSAEAKDRRGRNMRAGAITDLAYADGKIYIAGLSNQEFASTLRVVSYPFEDSETASSLEFYHAAHKKYETHSPIRTLMTYTLRRCRFHQHQPSLKTWREITSTAYLMSIF